jgi:hypothetical protein
MCLWAALASIAAQPAGADTLPVRAFIVSPIWHGEDERDAAKEVPQAIRLLGIEPGMCPWELPHLPDTACKNRSQ